MPSVPDTSPITGKPIAPSYIHTTSCNFVDTNGRSLLLRGVNLSGSSKAPVGHLSYLLDDFWETAEAGGESFVSRPLNIDDGSADVHLARLRGWGFNLLRFPFTWEAIEHDGPGKFDYEFMDYTIRVLCKCRDYGFRVYMDPHQDTWSRFSGGSGAPYWTLAACGIDPRNITATQSAIIHCEYPLAHEPTPAKLPAMVWSTNYGRLLSQTIFTLFFAGRDFAPNCIIDGVNIQDYLQNHFIEACGQLADRIKAFDGGSLLDDCIIGWDSMNEPFEGLCGWEDLRANPTKQGSTLKKGTYPTPAQSLRLGMGQAQTVENWTFGVTGPAKNGSVTIDPKGRKVWADPAIPEDDASPHDPTGAEPVGELPDGTHPRWGWKRDVSKWTLGTCIWAQHGVWDIETGFVLRPDYFHFHPITGIEIEFLTDYWKPHWIAYAKRIRQAHEEAIILVQPPVFAPPPRFEEEELQGRCVYAPHYYDGLTLITRHWNWFNADALGLLRGKYSNTLQAVKVGEAAIRKSLHEQLGYFQDDVPSLGKGDYPTVIGEIGTPFDMDDRRSYGWTDGGKHKGDYSNQEKALDASLNACDAWTNGKGHESLNWTIWTYVADDHSHEWGDGWNMEDLSLFSPADLRNNDDDDDSEETLDDVDKDMESIVALDDGLHSRAKLLPTKGSFSNGRRIVRTQQPLPAPSPPMAATHPTLSLASLAAASVASSMVGHNVLQQRSSRPRRMRALSNASDSTVSTTASVSARSPYLGIAGYSSNPYTLLTNGARAVRAFARPWPVKVVGRATDVRFDIRKASFKLTVSVGWEDRIRNDDARLEGDAKPEALATEVYIPLVHYAHPLLLEDAEKRAARRRGRSAMWTAKAAEGDRRSINSVNMYGEERTRGGPASEAGVDALSLSMMTTFTNATTTGTTEISHNDAGSPQSQHSASTVVDGSGDVPKDVLDKKAHHQHRPHASASGTAPLLIQDSTPDLVDVEVKVSGGRFEVRGQTLFWWYDVPEEDEGDVRREYVLEVKRRGGALKPRKGRAAAVPGASARSSGWCEQLCPEDGPCVIS